MTQVEIALKRQKKSWSEISDRILSQTLGVLPPQAPRRLLLFGLGSSHFAAQLTAYALIRAKWGGRITIAACESQEIGYRILPTQGDLAIGFSHRGRSASTLQAHKICDHAGVPSFLIAAHGVAAQHAERSVIETIEPESIEPHTVAVSSSICAATTLLMGKSAALEWERLAQLADPDLSSLQEQSGMGPDLLIGEWESYWLAREGALKLMEMAGVSPGVFGSEEFFHGPRWSAKSKTNILYLLGDGDPREMDLKSVAPDLKVMRVSTQTPLSWMPALVELQWYSLAVALNRGVDPDFPERRV